MPALSNIAASKFKRFFERQGNISIAVRTGLAGVSLRILIFQAVAQATIMRIPEHHN